MGEPAFNADGLRVYRARVRGADNAARARRGLEAALIQCNARAIGLPPRALLVLGRVAPARPLRIAAAGTDPAFARALLAQLADGRRAAVRPWTEPVTGASGAVIFADESELVACVIRDWLRGDLGGHWWAPPVLGGRGIDDWWRSGLLVRGDLLPPVLVRLAAGGAAADWVRRLPSDDIDLGTRSIARAHGLGLDGGVDGAHPSTPDGDVAAKDPEAVEQLLARVPEARSCADSIERSRLLGLALGLMRDPGWVRRGGIDRAVSVLRARDHAAIQAAAEHTDKASDAPDQDPPTPGDPDAPEHPSGPQGQDAGVAHEDPADPTEHRERPGVHRHERAPAETGRAAQAAPERRGIVLESTPKISADSGHDDPNPPGQSDPGTPPAAETPSSVVRIASEPASPDPRPESSAGSIADAGADPREASSEDQTLLPRATDADATPPGPTWATGLVERYHTRFGGLFYLLNLALALELYPDFTRPRDAGLGLSPWDWLALVGRAWWGRALVGDPIWEVLRILAVRDRGQPPGVDFAPPRDWLMPGDWPKPWGRSGTVTVHSDHRRLRLVHPTGFLLADLPRSPGLGVIRQARQIVRRWPCLEDVGLRHLGPWSAARLPKGRAGPPGTFEQGPNRLTWRPTRLPTARWLSILLPYLEQRLSLALGVDAPHRVRSLVCAHRARLDISSTALDIHLSLSDLPLAIRVAGLDRDPGWIPTAGRTIAFHFQ